MKMSLRYAGLLAVLLLVLFPAVVIAQDNDTSDSDEVTAPISLNVVGSGVVAPLLSALAEATDGAVTLELDIAGTDIGFTALCGNSADVALSARPITEGEEAFCGSAGVAFVEVLLANNALAVVVNATNDFATCLTATQLGNLFSPSSVGNNVQWSNLNASFPEEAISIYLPAAGSLPAFLLDRLVSGDGFRVDAEVLDTTDALLAAVAADVNAVGVVSASALVGAEGVRALELSNTQLNACYALSASSIEDRAYVGGERLFAYVNAERFEDFKALAEQLTGDASDVVMAAGYLPVSDSAGELLAGILADGTTGRVFTREVTAFSISPAVAGIFSVSGNAAGFGYLTAIQQSMGASYPRVELQVALDGAPAGVRRLCNGEVDAVFMVSDLTAEQAESCDANNVTTFELSLGSQVTVLVANASSDYLTCLTTEQLRNIWRAQENLPLTWDAVSASFPAEDMFLFAPLAGDAYTEIMLNRAGDPAAILRPVTENRADPLYRAAAVGNVPGALTYMSWQDYQRVLGNGQENITLVQVDGGNGCVTPDESTVADGSYALARGAKLLVRETSVATETTRAVLWHMVSDASYPLLTGAGYAGVSLRDLVDLRADLQARYDAFDAEVAARLAEPTEQTNGDEESDDEAEGDAPETVDE